MRRSEPLAKGSSGQPRTFPDVQGTHTSTWFEHSNAVTMISRWNGIVANAAVAN